MEGYAGILPGALMKIWTLYGGSFRGAYMEFSFSWGGKLRHHSSFPVSLTLKATRPPSRSSPIGERLRSLHAGLGTHALSERLDQGIYPSVHMPRTKMLDLFTSIVPLFVVIILLAS